MENQNDTIGKNKWVMLMTDSIGRYPIPAVKGGAVQCLAEHLIGAVDKSNLLSMDVITYFDSKAFELAKGYPNINFIWIRIPKVIETMDNLLFKMYRTVFPYKKSVSFRSLISLLYYIVKTHRILSQNNYDKVLIENNIPVFMIFKGLIKKYNHKYYFHLHNVPRTSAWCKKIIQNSERILCVSDFVGKEIVKDDNPIGPIKKSKIKIFYNCIDTSIFRPIHKKDYKLLGYKQKFKIKDNDKVIVFSGRLSAEKGVDILLKAIKGIDTKNLVVLIVGSFIYGTNLRDAYYDELQELIFNHKEKIVFTGYVPNNDMPYIYNLANIAVFPSMWDEPAGLTMIEAMACGIPTIATNSGGIPEYVSDACIILERDERLIDELNKEISRLLENEELCGFYGAKGIERVNKNFSKENYLDQFLRIID